MKKFIKNNNEIIQVPVCIRNNERFTVRGIKIVFDAFDSL